MRIRLVADTTVAAYAAERRLGIRETEVLELGAAGCSTKEAAELLRVSTGTISTHWQRIFRKTGCRNQREVFFRLGELREREAALGPGLAPGSRGLCPAHQPAGGGSGTPSRCRNQAACRHCPFRSHGYSSAARAGPMTSPALDGLEPHVGPPRGEGQDESSHPRELQTLQTIMEHGDRTTTRRRALVLDDDPAEASERPGPRGRHLGEGGRGAGRAVGVEADGRHERHSA